MDDLPQSQGEENEELARERRKYKILFIAKCLLGIGLFLLGVLAVINSGKSDGSGPPYFIGAFLVGFTMTILGIMDLYISFLLTSNDQSTLQTVAKCICFEVPISFISTFCGFVGIILDAVSGVGNCDFSCSYTVNIETNQNIAIAILVFLIVSVILGIASIVLNTTSKFGLPGAEIHPQENATVHPIVRYNPGNQGATGQHPTFRHDESVNQLHEQNRLLKEQIALQKQLQSMQQQQHQQLDASSTMQPPPPSYESCLQDPV